MKNAKQEIITFKADQSLIDAMQGVPNRSEFIREALLAALDGVCPLCRGTGNLTPNQKRHWNAFATHHDVAKCGECDETHLVCSESRAKHVHV